MASVGGAALESRDPGYSTRNTREKEAKSRVKRVVAENPAMCEEDAKERQDVLTTSSLQIIAAQEDIAQKMISAHKSLESDKISSTSEGDARKHDSTQVKRSVFGEVVDFISPWRRLRKRAEAKRRAAQSGAKAKTNTPVEGFHANEGERVIPSSSVSLSLLETVDEEDDIETGDKDDVLYPTGERSRKAYNSETVPNSRAESSSPVNAKDESEVQDGLRDVYNPRPKGDSLFVPILENVKHKTSKRLLFLVGSGGGRHKAAAKALKYSCEMAKKNFRIDIAEVSRIFGKGMTIGDGVSNWLVSRTKSSWLSGIQAAGTYLTQINKSPLVQQFQRFWRSHQYDACISFCPFLNEVLAKGLEGGEGSPLLITIMTDFENSRDHPWMQDQGQIIICGTLAALKQAEALGHPPERLYGTSGIIVHPKFYENPQLDRKFELEKLNLNPELRTCVVFEGGFGPSFLPRIVTALEEREEALNIILMCDNNYDVQMRLFALLSPEAVHRCPLHVVGFTDEVAIFMRLADFVITKPGPGVVSESLVARRPLILLCNEDTLLSEKPVARWAEREGFALSVEIVDEKTNGSAALSDLKEAVASDIIDELHANVCRFNNNAVFEVPHILDGVIKANTFYRKRSNSTSSLYSFDEDTSTGMLDETDREIGEVPSSVTSLDYKDYLFYYSQPLMLTDGKGANGEGILINAASKTGHDVILYSVSDGKEGMVEFVFSSGYSVTWWKQITICDPNDRLTAKLMTEGDDHGPHSRRIVLLEDPHDMNPHIIIPKEHQRIEKEIGTGWIYRHQKALKLTFYKAGFLGMEKKTYVRFLDLAWCDGKVVNIQWSRDALAGKLQV